MNNIINISSDGVRYRYVKGNDYVSVYRKGRPALRMDKEGGLEVLASVLLTANKIGLLNGWVYVTASKKNAFEVLEDSLFRHNRVVRRFSELQTDPRKAGPFTLYALTRVLAGQ